MQIHWYWILISKIFTNVICFHIVAAQYPQHYETVLWFSGSFHSDFRHILFLYVQLNPSFSLTLTSVFLLPKPHNRQDWKCIPWSLVWQPLPGDCAAINKCDTSFIYKKMLPLNIIQPAITFPSLCICCCSLVVYAHNLVGDSVVLSLLLMEKSHEGFTQTWDQHVKLPSSA